MTTTTPIASVVAEAAIDILARFADSGEWDLPPSIGILVDTDPPMLLPVELPDEVWKAAHPSRVVQHLAQMIRERHMRILDESTTVTSQRIIGAVLILEAWGMHFDGMTPDQVEEIREWAAHHSLRDHPSGKVREIRSITAMDASGSIALGEHARGEAPDTTLHDGPTGNVPEALHALLTAIRETHDSVQHDGTTG